MAEVINLRRARKAKERDARDQQAAQNRRQFGQTKSEKNIEKARREKAERAIDGHLREPSGDKK